MEVLPKEMITIRKDVFEPFKYGRKIGYYQLGRTIGEGSFAKVKEAIHLLTGEKVAVKIIDKNKAKEDLYISKNLRREARILQLLRHPNIVQLFEVIETDGFYYLVMEYCAGGELLDYICSRKKLEENVARKLIGQLVSAVHNMHQSNIVHRDLKIENFLLSANENLKIVDFGLSNTLPEGSLTEYKKTNIYPQLLNTHCGSPAYAAPELLSQKKYGPQIDVWSIGINMYAMLTGYLPYMMEPFNVMEMYEKMMQRKMTPIPSYLSKECRDLLMRLLEPVPEWRISLRQVMKHQWFKDTRSIPPVFDDSINQLVEAILKYMRSNLNIKTKDAINAVVSNKANHSSAVYHLLNRRLARYLRKNKNTMKDNYKNFPKVEIIKKASLSTDNVTKTPSKSKFTYQGKKIESNMQQDVDGHTDDGIYDNVKNEQMTNNSNKKISATEIAEYLANIKKGKTKNESDKLQNSKEINNNNRNIDNENTHSTQSPTRRPSIVDVLREDFIKGNSPTEIISTGNVNKNKREGKLKLRKSFSDKKSSPSESETISNEVSQESTTMRAKKPIENSVSNDSAYSGEVSPFFDDAFKSPDDWFDVDPWSENIKDLTKKAPTRDEVIKRPNDKDEMIIQEKDMPAVKLTAKIPPQEASDMSNKCNDSSRRRPEKVTETKKLTKDINTDDVKELKKTHEILRRFNDSPKATQKRLRKVSCPVGRSNSPDREEYAIENLKKNEQLLIPNVKTLRENKPSNYIKEIRHEFVKTPAFNNTFQLNEIETRDGIMNRANKGDPNEIPQTVVKSNIKMSHEKTTCRMKDRSFSVGSVDLKEVDENNNDVTDDASSITTDCRPKTSELIPSINKISPSKKTLELNVKQFTQFKTLSFPKSQQEASAAKSSLKPLELKFNFDKYRKKKAYTKRQVTKSLTNINGGLKVEEKEPVAEQMLSMRLRVNNEDIRTCNPAIKTIQTKMDVATDRKISKTTIKVTTSAPNRLIRPNTKLKIKGSLSFDTPSEDESTNQVFTIERLQELRNNGEETPPFDSGFFGNTTGQSKKEAVSNNSPEVKDINESDDEEDSRKLNDNTNVTADKILNAKPNGILDDASSIHSNESGEEPIQIGVAVRRRSIDSDKESEPVVEVQHARYRCQPVYKPEHVHKPALQNHSAPTIQNSRDDSFLNRRNHSVNDRRYASMRTPSHRQNSQRSRNSETAIGNDEQTGFEKPKSAKLQAFLSMRQKNLDEGVSNFTQEENLIFRKNVAKNSVRHYPIERTFVGSASPKFHRRATIGMVSAPSSGRDTPTLYDPANERKKLTEFSKTLTNAVWRKKQFQGN